MGVILIIAVTVALSAGIGVYLDKHGMEELHTVPPVSWLQGDTTAKLEVVKAPENLAWSDYGLLADQELRFALDDGPGLDGSAILPGSRTAVDDAGFVLANQALRFCGADGGTGVARQGVTVQVVHVTSGRLAHAFTFENVAAC